ncbi:MAG: ferric reductase-like transmembrane domain-containing protein, partial [Patescibacteria group bacterium]|nr:ferric reductase-like transmembrane domain-containing protein [Patescibacteria group bacterium]
IPPLLFLFSIFKILPDKLQYNLFVNMGHWSFLIFTFIVFIKPLSKLFKKVKFFKKSLTYRKELGILIFWLGIFHSIFLFFNLKMNLLPLNNLTSLTLHISWGILAFILIFFLGITSNNFSLKKLKKDWKKVQYLTYFAYAFVCIHKALVSNKIHGYIFLGVYIILRIATSKHFRKFFN